MLTSFAKKAALSLPFRSTLVKQGGILSSVRLIRYREYIVQIVEMNCLFRITANRSTNDLVYINIIINIHSCDPLAFFGLAKQLNCGFIGKRRNIKRKA